MKIYDFVIVGAGVVGLTVAREMTLRRLGSVCLLEKENAIGKHASGRNSGVVHAGIYYSPGSLKARHCVEGARLLGEYCHSRSIAFRRCGKVIVARGEGEFATLDELERRALANSVRVQRVDEKALKEIEPEACTARRALYSPDTAIVDSHGVLEELKKELAAAGAELRMSSKALSMKEGVVTTGHEKIAYGHLVNTAGLHADSIAHSMGVGLSYKILPFKGVYRKLKSEASSRIRALIYPVPDLAFPFLGVHLTKTVHGETLVGPTAAPAFGRENYTGLNGVDFHCAGIGRDLLAMLASNANGFRSLAFLEISHGGAGRHLLESARKLVPFLKKTDLQDEEKVGIRAQLVETRTLKFVMDFVVESGPNSTHILNAVSPAFTGSFAFAQWVVDRMERPAVSS